jgi:DNA-binding response OmpR family regulator
MTGEPALNGQRILIVEDNYLLAGDAAHALRGAGAEIIGPFPDERTATDEIKRQAPTAAIIDINLGAGPAFNLARALAERQVPFLFMTGYDAHVVPEEFAHIERVQKPVELPHIVRSFARLLKDGKAN